MAFKEVTLERIPSQDSVLYVNKSGLSFSANFVKKHNLEDAEGIKFFQNDEDPYLLGFKFTQTTNEPNTLTLVAQGRSKGGSAGFTIKASELINKNAILKNVQKLPAKQDRTFEIHFDEKEGMYSILLRPNFEISISWLERNKVPEEFKGIYRYLNNDGQIIYIGKGGIRTRANSPERKDWGVSKIEYSVILEDEKSYFWENFYIERYVATQGAKPPFNVIMGKSE